MRPLILTVPVLVTAIVVNKSVLIDPQRRESTAPGVVTLCVYQHLISLP
jgi:exosome complex RNA-binding protein Rrp42 (RNase PH superfamily)